MEPIQWNDIIVFFVALISAGVSVFSLIKQHMQQQELEEFKARLRQSEVRHAVLMEKHSDLVGRFYKLVLALENDVNRFVYNNNPEIDKDRIKRYKGSATESMDAFGRFFDENRILFREKFCEELSNRLRYLQIMQWVWRGPRTVFANRPAPELTKDHYYDYRERVFKLTRGIRIMVEDECRQILGVKEMAAD